MSDVKRYVWDAMLDADMNVRYWGYIARKYSRYDKWLRFLVALTSSAAVGSFEIWRYSTGLFDWSLMWDLLCATAVVVAVALPFLEFSKVAMEAQSAQPIWRTCGSKYEDLWLKRRQLSPPALQSRYSAIKQDQIKETSSQVTLPRNTKLIVQCQSEVRRARGLN